MEQVLVLNGLNGQVDTRGTSASCAQSPDGSVTCLDTPLGAAAARAAEVGGDVGAYAASRLDVLAQSARAESTEAEQRADGLEADASSAHRIGEHGSADQLTRAAEAARLQARASLAQSAAAAAAAQAVRIGDARRALMAADAVVAAAWRSDLAEVNAGALMGLGLGADPGETLRVKQAVPKEVPDVAKFSVTDTDKVRGQIVGSALVLVGVKPGTTNVEIVSPTGARKTIAVTVDELLPGEQLRAAQDLYEQAKRLGGSPAELTIDWQDADVLRASYDAIYPALRLIYATARDEGVFDTYRPQRYQSLFLLRVLIHAKSNPNLKTLRDVVMSLPTFTDEGTTVRAPAGPVGGWSPSGGRECSRNSQSGVVFHDLYVFTRDREAVFAVTRFVLDVADFVAKIWKSLDPGTGKTIEAGVKAARAVAAPLMGQFATDPKRLVASFGNAVCVAIAGGSSALPVATRAAASLRAQAINNARRYRGSLVVANDTRVSSEGRAAAVEAARTQKRVAQDALVKLATFDVPSAFTATQNAELEAAKAVVNADTSLAPGGASTGGGGGAVVAVGAAAAAFALWRFLR